MSAILKFILNAKQKTLGVHLNNNTSSQNHIISLSYEYLRIFSPSELSKIAKTNNALSIPEVFHKKDITITFIESVGKHGYRIVFDDGYNDTFSGDELLNLAKQFDQYWPIYINSLSSANSREASINFKSIT